MKSQETIPVKPLNRSVDDACIMLGIKRAQLYRIIASGELRTIKLGRRRLVPVRALEEYQKKLERQSAA